MPHGWYILTCCGIIHPRNCGLGLKLSDRGPQNFVRWSCIYCQVVLIKIGCTCSVRWLIRVAINSTWIDRISLLAVAQRPSIWYRGLVRCYFIDILLTPLCHRHLYRATFCAGDKVWAFGSMDRHHCQQSVQESMVEVSAAENWFNFFTVKNPLNSLEPVCSMVQVIDKDRHWVQPGERAFGNIKQSTSMKLIALTS